MNTNGIAKFYKVSEDQFFKDFDNCMKDGTFSTSWMIDAQCDSIDDYNNMIKESYNSIKLPTRATKHSAGYDIFAPMDIYLPPGRTTLIPTGIGCEISEGWFMGIYPRSGQGFKFGIHLANTVGIIDGDYCMSDNEGHILIKLVNDSCISKSFVCDPKMAFAQAIFMPYGTVECDNTTAIRNGGFGSTNRLKTPVEELIEEVMYK